MNHVNKLQGGRFTDPMIVIRGGGIKGGIKGTVYLIMILNNEFQHLNINQQATIYHFFAALLVQVYEGLNLFLYIPQDLQQIFHFQADGLFSRDV